jgi:cytochrome c556
VPRLQALRLLSNDLDLAFPGLKDSDRFQQHAAGCAATSTPRWRAAQRLHRPGQVVETVQADCRACHQDFR